MTDANARECRPPEGAQNGSYHWLQASVGDFVPAQWSNGRWYVCGWEADGDTPSEIVRAGMTYVGPCIPPQETEGGHG